MRITNPNPSVSKTQEEVEGAAYLRVMKLEKKKIHADGIWK